METNEPKEESVWGDKAQSYLTEKKKTTIPYKYHESIMLILWGWVMFIDYFRFYISRKFMISFDARKILEFSSKAIVVAGVVYTAYYLSKRMDKLKTDLGKSLIIVWLSMFVSLVMVYLIQLNVMHTVVFELQHAMFMVLSATAIVLTGRLIHNKGVFYGGIIFALLGFGASYLKLTDQLLLESLGWLLAFVIPGHVLYSKQKKDNLE